MKRVFPSFPVNCMRRSPHQWTEITCCFSRSAVQIAVWWFVDHDFRLYAWRHSVHNLLFSLEKFYIVTSDS